METEINEVKEPTTEINKKLTKEDLIKRYAKIQQISIEEAEEQVGAPTEEEILKKIQDKTIEKINSTQIPMNRAKRRALRKKVGAKKYAELIQSNNDALNAVSETAKKLDYINLIQKLRALNERKEKENAEHNDEEN